jgi:hypothetical protein
LHSEELPERGLPLAKHSSGSEVQMANDVSQNPSNKVGRNSGAGSSGISTYTPTAREAARGLGPSHVESGRAWGVWSLFGMAAAAAAGAGLYLRRERKKRTGWRGALRKVLPID